MKTREEYEFRLNGGHKSDCITVVQEMRQPFAGGSTRRVGLYIHLYDDTTHFEDPISLIKAKLAHIQECGFSEKKL